MKPAIITQATLYTTPERRRFHVALNRPGPSVEDMIYSYTSDGEGRLVYVGALGELFWFCVHDLAAEWGFGGRSFALKIGTHGTAHTVKGPWPSRCGIVNKRTGLNLVEVTTDTAQSFYVRASLLERFGFEFERKVDQHGEVTYEARNKR